MILRLIGAGLPRTGTSSLREALRRLLDAPFSNCWRDLAAAYPDAPVLLSRRGSAEVWYRSMAATVLPRTREILMKDDRDPLVPLFRVLFGDLFCDADDPEDVMAGYERWLREVRAEIEVVPSSVELRWRPP